MSRSFGAFALAWVTLAGCATASEDNTTDGGAKKDSAAAADLGAEVDDNGGGPADSWAVDETGEEDAAGTVDSTVEDTGSSVGDTGTAVKDTGTAVKDTGTVKDTSVPPTDTGPSCVVVEGFESGGMAAWTNVAGGTGGAPTFTSASAHDGTHGMNSTSATNFYWRAMPSVGKAGDKITAWVRGTGGRAYLGFSASSAGAKSFVIAPNTGDIRFQDNPGWTYTELNTTPTTFVAAHWYKAEIVFGAGGNVTGNLYDSDGKTLISTVTHAFGTVALGGIALRDYALDIDTITFCPAP